MAKMLGTKGYFAAVFVLADDIKALEEQICAMRAKQTGPGASLTAMPQKSTNLRRNEDLAVAVLMAEAGLAKKRMLLLALETEIKKLADTLDEPMTRAIVTWRYICRYMWKDIARRADLSEMQVIRQHNAAMEAMECHRLKPVENCG